MRAMSPTISARGWGGNMTLPTVFPFLRAMIWRSTLTGVYTEFNQISHNLGAGLEVDINGLTLGLSYTYIATMLDGDRFLDMQVLSPSVSTFVTDMIYVRAAYLRYRKDFDVLGARDADTDVGNLSAFFFFDQYRSFWNLSLSFEKEDATLAQYDFDGFEGSASLNYAMEGFGRSNILRLGISYRDRDYDSITPLIGTARQDEKVSLDAALTIPLSEVAQVQGSYTYADRTSNLPVADYQEHVVQLLLGFEF